MVKGKKYGNTYLFTAVWNGMQITRGSECRHAIQRVSIFNLHYFISHFVLHSL